jgi:hypothetical protein
MYRWHLKLFPSQISVKFPFFLMLLEFPQKLFIKLTSEHSHFFTNEHSIPAARLAEAQKCLYDILIKMCVFCTDDISQTKLAGILLNIVNCETRDFHTIFFQQITQTKNCKTVIPQADKILKTLCLRHKLSKG